ncbi:MAG: Ku protein, partial [Vicinamibacterales bacterium]
MSVKIRVFPATDPRADVSFRQLHATCHTPIELKRWCPHCQREISRDEILKGYEFERGRYVVFTDEEIDAARPESTRVIDLAQVMPRADIDPVLIERAYWLAPDEESAGEPFAVIREALGDRAAIGRLALHGREYLVA